MARIAGVFGCREGEERELILEALLRSMQSRSGEASHQVGLRRARLGWCGRSASKVVEARGILVALDGHIYNREQFGYEPDDELLFVRLYGEFGFEGALARVNGDFAVALFDVAEDVLWVARDRFGVRPLYYLNDACRFAFASRPRALLMVPGVRREPNRRFVALFAASHYRTFDNDPSTSPYEDIAQLPAGHLLEVHEKSLRVRRWWSLTEEPEWTDDERALAARYRELLIDAVRLRLRSLPKPAFSLSGGMDSSSVLACGVKASGARQHAFSALYTDPTYDESADIQPMLETTVEQWHPVVVGDPQVLALVRRMVAVNDEPVATATWLSHFLLCEQAARQGFGSLLGGLGGDELNAGEYEHFFFFFADLRAAGNERRLAGEIASWQVHHDHPVFRKGPAVAKEALARVIDPNVLGRCRPDQARIDRYRKALLPDYFDLSAFEPVMDEPFGSYLKNRTYQDLYRETIPCCLRAEDRQTVAFGLDHADPFLDHRLVEFMFRVPGTLKYRDGVTKHLLRLAMRGVLPEETRTRVKKTGWNAPAHLWFSGAGAESLRDVVNSRRFRERNIYDVAEVGRLIEEHDAIVRSGEARENHMMFLWQLVNLELWLEDIV